MVDVWLYSTPEMVQYEFKEDTTPEAEPPTPEQPQPIQPKLEPVEPEHESDGQTDNWLDFFSKEPKELDVDEMIIKPEKKAEAKSDLDSLIESNIITKCSEQYKQQWPDDKKQELPNEILNQPTVPKKRIVKYIDPTTGKIYYLEMDRNLDLSKVQEIVINNTTTKISPIKGNGLKNFRKKKGVSLLKPELKSLLKNEVTQREERKKNFTHIENDHCYLATPVRDWPGDDSVASVEVKKESSLYEHLCSVTYRLDSVRAGVNYMLKRIPLISDLARDPDFQKHFPFVVECYEKYWRMDFAKRRNIEVSFIDVIH